MREARRASGLLALVVVLVVLVVLVGRLGRLDEGGPAAEHHAGLLQAGKVRAAVVVAAVADLVEAAELQRLELVDGRSDVLAVVALLHLLCRRSPNGQLSVVWM